MTVYYSIASEIFSKFPDYCRGVVIASGIKNDASPAALVDELRGAEETVRQRLSLETILSHANIQAWREAYRSSGVKPSDFRPSVEGLARRVLRNDPLPSINCLVDLGNLLSLRHLLPIGAHAIDVVKGDIALRLAKGDEVFEPFGSDEIEHPAPGEIIFTEGKTVLTRRWTWRQAKHTLVTAETAAVEINVDGLPPVSRAQVEMICAETAELVRRYCGGALRFEIISIDKPSFTLKEQ